MDQAANAPGELGEAVPDRRETDKALYMSLAMVCKNKALDVVKTVTHKRGFESWRKLSKEFGATTGTSLHEYTNLLEYDFGTTDGFKKRLLKWENQIVDFQKATGEVFSDRLKCAIVLSRSPAPIRTYLRVQNRGDYGALRVALMNYLEAEKWRQALRIATQSPKRWSRRAAEWNPELIRSTRTQRKAGRPAKIWDDDLMEFATQRKDNKTKKPCCFEKSTNGKRKKNNTRSTLSKIEANFGKHLDDKTPTHSSTNDDFQHQQHHQQPQGNDSRKQDDIEVYDLCYGDFWKTWFSGDQDKWLSDSLLACNTLLNLSHPSFFHFVNFAQISTHCRLTVSFEVPFEPTALIFLTVFPFFFEDS